MIIALHKNARTTPAIRAEIASSPDSVATLAARYGVGEMTIRRWRKRTVFTDASHTAHRLQTTLSPAQEAICVELRKTLLLPLDDLLAVCREFICAEVSRSGLDRCLRRHGVGNLRTLLPSTPKEPTKGFKAYAPGFVHVDVKYLPQMADETSRSYLFVAIDRATRWVFVQIKSNKTAASARAFLKALHKACPIRISKVLTDNGKEFTDRLIASREGQPSGNHVFDQLCQELGIEHRLTKPRHPQTNGMVERFNGRISDVLKTHRFHSGEDMRQTLERYVYLYNHQLPQSALHSKTPMQTMKAWYDEKPELFCRQPRVSNRRGCDKYEYASCVISRDSADYFGNSRPYDIDFLIEPFYKKESIVLCGNPSMAMVIFRGSAQIEEILSGFQELANHAFFSEDNQKLRGIINLLKSSLVDRSEQCAVVAILRSYELHNS